MVHKPVPDEVVRHAEGPHPRLLDIVCLVIVGPWLLAGCLLRAEHNVVDDLVLHLVAVLDVNPRAHHVIECVRLHPAAMSTMDDDAALGGIFDGISQEQA